MRFEFIYDDSRLIVAPNRPEVKRLLKFQQKTITDDKVVKKTVNAFVETPDKLAIETYQGFMLNLKRKLQAQGHTVVVHDRRLEFPMPKLHLMHGFRFSQNVVVTEFLISDMSGLLGAPTRWGKSTAIINVLRAYPGVPTVVTVPGVDLVKQLYKDVQEKLPTREVKLIGAGSKVKYPSDDINVCSMDSLDKCNHEQTRLVLIDEPHACVTDSRIPEFLKFVNARKLGFGATLKGRFDGRDKLIEGVIGPVLVERTYKEAVAEGAISPLKVYFIKVGISGSGCKYRLTEYRRLLYWSKRIAGIVQKLCRDVIPDHWQTLIFIKEEKQAELILSAVGEEGTIAMAKRLTEKQRTDLMARIKSGEVRRVIASDILAQGVTMSDMRCLINTSGGGPYTSCIQKPGRLAEIRPDIPDKKYGIVFDLFFFDDGTSKHGGCWSGLCAESLGRYNAYKEKGYEIEFVTNMGELKEKFQEHVNYTVTN